MILPGRGTTGAKSASAAGTGAAPARGRPSPPAASTSPTSAASSGTSMSPSSRAAVVPYSVRMVASRIAPRIACPLAAQAGGRCGSGARLARPVVLRGLGRGHRLRCAETRCHRGRRPRQYLVVLDVQEPQPALLAHGQGDEAAELDQFRLGEMPVKPVPQLIAGVQVPRDRLRVGQRRLLAFGEGGRALEVEQVVVLPLAQALGPGLLRALVPAVLAFHRARYVHPAQFLDRVVAYSVAEDRFPRPGERPETGGHVRPHGRTLRPRGALPH